MAGNHRLWTPGPSPIEAVKIGARGFIDAPPGNDPVNAYIGEAVLREIDGNRSTRRFIDRNFRLRHPTPPPHAFGIINTSIKEGILYPYRRDPYEMTTVENPFSTLNSVEAAQAFIREYWRPRSMGRRRTAFHIRHDNVGTTVSNRYVLPLLITTMLQHTQPPRLDEDLHVVDVGPSNMTELKRWALRAFGTYLMPGAPEIPDVVSPILRPDSTIEYQSEEEIARHLYLIWRSLGSVAIGVGIDSMDISSHATQRWINSSDYPGFYKDPVAVEEKNFFTDIRPGNVEFVQGDITKLNHALVRNLAKRMGATKEHFDVAMAITVLHEMTPEQQAIALENLAKLVGPNGIVIIQDFVGIDPNDPTKLVNDVRSFGEPYKYRTYVYANGVLRLWFISESGRVHRVQIGPEFGMVGDEQVLSPEDQKIFKVNLRSDAA